jgi:hypothetical protein
VRLSDNVVSIGAYEGFDSAPKANLVTNPGFEAGTISPWETWGTQFEAVAHDASKGQWAGKAGPNAGGILLISAAPNTTGSVALGGDLYVDDLSLVQ